MRFECVILPDLAYVANMLELEEWNIYGILDGDRLKSVYVFQHDGILLSSIDACEFIEIFQIGFEQACLRLAKNVTVHQIGDSTRLRIPRQLLLVRVESLYMYNYITHMKKNSECLIMN
jgi:hypothetical protein